MLWVIPLADISIIEWGVYGFVAYSSLLMLIISVVKEVPDKKSQSILRSMWFIPGVICAGLLMFSSVNIVMETTNTVNTITDNQTSTIIFTEDITVQRFIPIQDPVWQSVHLMIFLILLSYVVIQILTLFTKID